jgi:hypothetical protein
MADDEVAQDRLNSWQDALQAADLTVRLISDAVRLEPEGPDPSGSEVAYLAERVAEVTCDASDRASEAAARAREQAP